MITSLSWLKNHLATKANLNQIVERLTAIGLEVENIKSSNGNLDNFIICKIIKSQKHPNADKLKLCEVDIGTGNLVKVVCGAQNARDGLFAVYAPPGAIIPKTNMKLKVVKIRGIESFGMLCSGYELEESSNKEGIIELNKKEKNIGDKYFKSSGEKIIDIGGESTRPSSKTITDANEWFRINMIITEFKKNFPGTILSLDTRKSKVMINGIKNGVDIINDVSGLNFDKKSFDVVKSKQIPLILHHMQGTPNTMQQNPTYDDVLLDIFDF